MIFDFSLFSHKDFDGFKHSRRLSGWNWEETRYKSFDRNSYPWPIISHQYDGLRLMMTLRDTDCDFLCRGPNQGFRIYWNRPSEVPNTLSQFLFIPIGRDITISMKPSVIETSKNLLKYPSKLRQCYTEEEKKLRFFKFYTKSNCEFECLTNFTLKHCGCVKFSMPRDNATLVCNATKIKCIFEAERTWLSLGAETHDDAVECNCMAACLEINYDPLLIWNYYDFHRMFKSYDYDLTDMPGLVERFFSLFWKFQNLFLA